METTNTNTTTRAGRKRSRAVKVTAALIGALLAGTAAYAALSWYQTRGAGEVNRASVGLTLSSVTSNDATAVAADPYLDGSTVAPGTATLAIPGVNAPTTAAVVNGEALSSFGFGSYNGLAGYSPTLTLNYTRSNAAGTADWQLQRVVAVPAGAAIGTTFPAGTAPVVVWVKGTGCGKTLTATNLTAAIDVGVMTTSAAPPSSGSPERFDLVAQWVPPGAYVAGTCNATAPTTEVAP